MAIPVVLLTLVGCGFHAPSPELLDAIRALPPAEGNFLRAEVEATFDSKPITGTFPGVLVATPRPAPRLRLQLFPDLGSKVLDLVIGGTGLDALVEGDPDPLQLRFPSPTPLDPSLPLLLGATLLEHITPLDADRVIGARSHREGQELELSPAPSGVGTRVVVDDALRVVERRHRFGRLRWSVIPGNPLRVQAWGFEMELRFISEESMEAPANVDLFFQLFPADAP